MSGLVLIAALDVRVVSIQRAIAVVHTSEFGPRGSQIPVTRSTGARVTLAIAELTTRAGEHFRPARVAANSQFTLVVVLAVTKTRRAIRLRIGRWVRLRSWGVIRLGSGRIVRLRRRGGSVRITRNTITGAVLRGYPVTVRITTALVGSRRVQGTAKTTTHAVSIGSRIAAARSLLAGNIGTVRVLVTRIRSVAVGRTGPIGAAGWFMLIALLDVLRSASAEEHGGCANDNNTIHVVLPRNMAFVSIGETQAKTLEIPLWNRSVGAGIHRPTQRTA